MRTELSAMEYAILDALNSGDYNQGNGALRYSDGGAKEFYCCLGVMCDVLAPDRWQPAKPDDPRPDAYKHVATDDLGSAYLPHINYLQALSLRPEQARELASYNDEIGATFGDIAELLARYWYSIDGNSTLIEREAHWRRLTGQFEIAVADQLAREHQSLT